MNALDLVVAGNLLVDDVVSDDGSARIGAPGGALLHCALAAALWKAKVGLVSVVGTDYPAASLALLASRGVDLEGLRHLGAPGARVWLLYESGIRRMIPHLGRPDHDAVSPTPDDVPQKWRATKALHVAPMPLARQRAMLAANGGSGPLVSVDPCDHLTAETLPAFVEMANRADVLFVSDDEITIDEKGEVLSRLARGGQGKPRYVLHKCGREGGTVFHPDGARTPWRAANAKTVDPTGAGDAFAAAFMVALVNGASLDDALARAAVTAAVAVEGPSSDPLAATSFATLSTRERAYVESTSRQIPPAGA